MVVVMGVTAIAWAMIVATEPAPATLAIIVGCALISAATVAAIRAYVAHRAETRSREIMQSFIAKDVAPSFITDDEGAIISRNAAAFERLEPAASATLAGAMRSVFANPTAVLYRLQKKAELQGAAREDIVTRSGHIRLAVHQLTQSGFLWRLEDIPERNHGGRGDTLPIPMITVGRNGAILFMNDAARTLAGKRVKAVEQLFEDTPIRKGVINVAKGQHGPVEVMVAERETLAGRSELYLMPSPGKSCLKQNNVFETLPVPLLRMAPDGTVLEANALAKALLNDENCIGNTLSSMMHGLGRSVGDWLHDTVKRHPTPQAEVLQLTQTDRDMFLQVTLSRVVEAGETSLIGVLNDATELKTLEAQFVQSQKMQAIGQLAGGVAHDFNNLLTAISGHCDLLLLRHDQGDADYGDLIQINQNANRAAALVSQLLAFSRKQTLRPEVVDLRDILADLTHLLNRLVGEKVTLTLIHDPLLKCIRADKRQLEQVLMNLVVNARDAMPDGGEIKIETAGVVLKEHLKRDRAQVAPGRYVTVKVSDEGTGIAADKLQKVFEPFYTTKRTGEGTGLGLSTAYGIIKQSGGFIFVDSIPGTGTEFTLYFPAHEPEDTRPAPQARARAPACAQHGEGVVLLVEDEAPVRAFASRALRLRGYTVLEAESAEDALETLKDTSLAVDVFVTDVVMPGMDGPSWVRQALLERPDVRVVFVSGYAEGALEDTDTSIPNSVFLPKPFSLNQLTDTVYGQLH